MATVDLFYCSVPQTQIPKDILTSVLATTLTNQAWEYFNTADVAPNLYAAKLLDYSDYCHFTNPMVQLKEKKNSLLFSVLPSKGNQKRTLFLFCQCLVQARPTMHLAPELRTTALKECGVETTHDIPELSNIDANLQEMVTSLKAKCVPVDLAKMFANNIGLTDDDLGDDISTNLGELVELWIRKDYETCTPQRLVEALICTKGLGRYASGITVISNGREVNNFLCDLGNDWWMVVEFLGYSKTEIQRSLGRECGSSRIGQVAAFISSIFQLPNCGVHTSSILSMLAQKAGVDSQKQLVSEPMLTPYSSEEPRLKPSHFITQRGLYPSQSPISACLPLSYGSWPTSSALFDAAIAGPTMPPWIMAQQIQSQSLSFDHPFHKLLERISAQMQFLMQNSVRRASEPTTTKSDDIHCSPPTIKLDGGSEARATADSERFKRDNSADIIQQCKKGDLAALDIIDALLESGSDPTEYISEENGSHPLHLAVLSKSSQLISTLVGFYSSKNLINATNDDQQTALMLACKEKIKKNVRILLDYNADANALDKNGISCLHMRETLEKPEIVQLLLEKGALVDIPSEESKLTPLTLACYLGEIESVGILLSAGANPNGLPGGASSPLCAAAQGGHKKIVQMILAHEHSVDVNCLDWENCSPLLRACRGGHTDIVSALVSKNADINLSDKNGNTPVLAAVEGNYVELLQLLIVLNADVDKGKFITLKDSSEIEVTPLALAAGKGSLDMVQSLVEGKANVNFFHERAASALSHAVAQDHADVVGYLLKVNDFIATIDTLRFPLKTAADAGDLGIIQLLLDALGGVEKVLTEATENEQNELVDIICEYNDKVKKSKNVPRTVNVAETNELASATSTSPNSQAQLHTSQRDIQVSLEETLDLFVKVAVETAVKKQGKEFILQKAKEKQFHHLSAFFDQFFSTPDNIKALFGEFVNMIPFPSPAYFIFEDEELFDGETFQETLSQTDRNPVEFLPVALLQIPDLDDLKLDGDGLIRLLIGSRFADAAERLKLYNVSELDSSPEGHKPWIDDLVRSVNCCYGRGTPQNDTHRIPQSDETDLHELQPTEIEQDNSIELFSQDQESTNIHVPVTMSQSTDETSLCVSQQCESTLIQVSEGSTPQRQAKIWAKSVAKAQHGMSKGKIKSKIPRFVGKGILKSVCGYRFEGKVITSSSGNNLFRELAERVINWKKLAERLNLDVTTVANICHRYEFDKERCYRALQHWKETVPQATYYLLAEALVKLKQEPLVAILYKFMNGTGECDDNSEGLKSCEIWNHKVSPNSTSTAKFIGEVLPICDKMEQSGYKAAEVTIKFVHK